MLSDNNHSAIQMVVFNELIFKPNLSTESFFERLYFSAFSPEADSSKLLVISTD